MMKVELNKKTAEKSNCSLNYKVLWRQARPHSLTASFIPVTMGTILAMDFTTINLMLFGAMMLASILIQIATNMFNEYYDYMRGLDTVDSVGIGGAIVRDGIAPKTVLWSAIICCIVALILGLYICANSTYWLIAIGLICIGVGYFYSGGPYPIAYSPFGEIVAGLFMGPVIIGIAFYIQTGFIDAYSLIISVPFIILIGAILTANNIRDLDGDKKNGRNTLVIILGHEKAVKMLAIMLVSCYIWILGLIYFNMITIWALLIIISIPTAIKAVKGFIDKKYPIEMMPAMKYTAQTNTQFGALLILGILISLGN